jgi:hypothetical protein
MDMLFLHAFSHARSAWPDIHRNMQEFESSLDEKVAPSLRDEQLQWQLRISLRKFRSTTTQLAKARKITLIAFKVAYFLPMVATAGAICLILGTLCYVKDAQAIAVWICCMVLCVSLVLLLIILTVRRAM